MLVIIFSCAVTFEVDLNSKTIVVYGAPSVEYRDYLVVLTPIYLFVRQNKQTM